MQDVHALPIEHLASLDVAVDELNHVSPPLIIKTQDVGNVRCPLVADPDREAPSFGCGYDRQASLLTRCANDR